MATINSSLSATGSVALTLANAPGYADNQAVIQISGSFTGLTAVIEGSADGTNFSALDAQRLDTLALESSPVTPDATAKGWYVNCTNLQKIRFRVTAISTNSVAVQINSAFFPVSPLPALVPLGNVGINPPGGPNTNQTAVTASSAGGAQANNCTLPGVAGKTTYITGFEVTGSGATAASVIAVTVTGTISGTLNYNVAIPAGVNTGITPLNVQFTEAIPASGTNTAIVVNVPSFGAGNNNASASAHGFQQ